MATHVAYGDECSYNIGRFRSIAIVTLKVGSNCSFGQAVRDLLDGSGVREFKWQRLRQARERFAAEKLVDFAIEKALLGKLRVDALIWDVEDSRHQIKGRDDIANLQRMYYHLFRDALARWPGDNAWMLLPDENSALDWQSVQDYLEVAGLSLSMHTGVMPLFRFRLSQEFCIEEIQEVNSDKVPLCQLADLFAGISVFSREKFSVYRCWKERLQLALPLFSEDQPITLSNSDRERCRVLLHLNSECKAHKLGVSLETKAGLWTPDPANPVNFWIYEPQHLDDKAPIRN